MHYSKLRTFVSISGLIIILVIMHFLGWTTPLEQALRSLLNPSSQAIYRLSVKVGDKTEKFANVDELKAAYQSVKSDWQNRLIADAQCQLNDSENINLRDQLAFFKNHTFQHIGADTIGKNIEPLGSTIILNRGTNDGVQVGNPVIVGAGVLVGKIMRAESTISVVQLLNDHQSKIGATILNQEKSLGLIVGGYGISIRMNFIPQNESVHVGDTVVTSGLEKNIPRGLVIGTVQAVEKEAYQPFQSAVVSPLYNLDKLSSVSILLP